MADGGQIGTKVSTSGDITLSYTTLAEAQTYFNSHLDTDDWDEASESDKVKVLVTASKVIDRLNILGAKTNSEQTFQFPRYDDASVPQAVKDAVCEEALMLIGGADITMEKEAAKMSIQTFGGTKSAYDVDMAILHLSAGLVSSVAFDIIKPFLRPPGRLDVIKI